jgi:hypothetical protein
VTTASPWENGSYGGSGSSAIEPRSRQRRHSSTSTNTINVPNRIATCPITASIGCSSSFALLFGYTGSRSPSGVSIGTSRRILRARRGADSNTFSNPLRIGVQHLGGQPPRSGADSNHYSRHAESALDNRPSASSIGAVFVRSGARSLRAQTRVTVRSEAVAGRALNGRTHDNACLSLLEIGVDKLCSTSRAPAVRAQKSDSRSEGSPL